MKEKLKYILTIATVVLVLTMTYLIVWYNNPRTIEHNTTIIKEIEKIVEIEKECLECITPTCAVCDSSIKCNTSECPYSSNYVLGLIRIAKKCERRDTFDIDECDWKLNKTSARLGNCTTDLGDCESDCLVYCDDIEYERDEFRTKFNNCTTRYKELETKLDDCNEDLDECENE
ncbi:hypothetical protein LCGC14_0363000 [marine sediment metagenome]|uniref:Uncharacterized protein n=1 Tax=marine sediment metagenome TaxID=412755 RepID=A0A0F9TD19_9ZZZZ